MSQYTSIRVTKDLREKLEGLGKKSETYNDLLERIIANNLLKSGDKQNA